MRKKIGEIYFKDKQNKIDSKISIWGSIFTNNNKIIGGIHFNVHPNDIVDFYPFIQSVLSIGLEFRLKYVHDEYGRRYRTSHYDNLNNFDVNKVVESLKDIPEYEDKYVKVSLKIKEDFDYVIDSAVIKSL